MVSCEVVCACQGLEVSTKLLYFIGYVATALLCTVKQHSDLCSIFGGVGRVATVGFVNRGQDCARGKQSEDWGGVGQVELSGDVGYVSVLREVNRSWSVVAFDVTS